MNGQEDFYRAKNKHLSNNWLDKVERQDYTGQQREGHSHTKYYDKLLRSGKIGGHGKDKGIFDLGNNRLRKSISCSETNLSEHHNPFVFTDSVDVDVPYNSAAHKDDKDRWLAYAMNIKSRQKSLNSRNEKTSSNPNLSVSEYFNSLYQRYPHSFQRRLQRDSERTQQRPSRRLFSSGLRVRFNDHVYVNTDDDSRSVCSERPRSVCSERPRSVCSERPRSVCSERPRSVCSERQVVTKWDQEMERIFGSKYANSKRSCLTNPTPSMVSDLSLKQELCSGSDLCSGNELRSVSQLNGERNQDDQEEIYANETVTDFTSQSCSRRSSSSEQISFDEHVRLLEQAIKDSEDELNTSNSQIDYGNENHDGFHKNGNKSQFESDLQWRARSLDSPPDSAIDVDTSSIQSSVSVSQQNTSNFQQNMPLRLDINTDQVLGEQTTEINGKLRNNYSVEQLEAGDFQSEQVTLALHQDSDIDSGIVPSTSDAISDSAKTPRSPTPVFNTTSPRQVQGPCSAVPYKPPKSPRHLPPHPKKGGNSKHSLHHYTDSEEDEALMREVTLSKVSRELKSHLQKKSRGSYNDTEDDTDDTNPRLGIAKITDDDKIIAEKYRLKQKPVRYCLIRGSSTARDRPPSAPTWQKSTSDSRISILCTPRPVDTNKSEFSYAAVRPQSESVIKRNLMKQFNDDKPSALQKTRSLENNLHNSVENVHHNSALSYKNQRFDQRTERRIRRHSQAYSSSNDSTISDVSENTLVASQMSLNEKHYDTQIISTEDFPVISDHNSRRKFHFKKLFKIKKGCYNPVSDDSNLTLGYHGNSNTPSSMPKTVVCDSGNVQFKRYASDGDLLNSKDEITPLEDEIRLTKVSQKENFASQPVASQPVASAPDLNGPSPRLTPYEASVVSMDKNGVDVDEIIDSDSDSMFSARPAVVQKGDNHDKENIVRKQGGKSPKEIILHDKHSSDADRKSVTLGTNRESFNSLPESNSTNSGEHYSVASLSSTESPSLPSVIHKKNDSSKSHNSSGNNGKAVDHSDQVKSTSKIASIEENAKGNNSVNQTSPKQPVEESEQEELVDDNPDDADLSKSEHIYAKVQYRTAENGGKPNLRADRNGRCVSDGFYGDYNRPTTNDGQTRQQKALSTSNVVTGLSEISLAEEDGPPLPNRNYHGSTSNLQKNKELSGSRLSLSNKVGNLKNAAKSKFHKLRKAISMDKGLNKSPTETEGSENVVKSKPPKVKKGLKLKKLFGKKSSKHRSTENLHHGAVYPPDTAGMMGLAMCGSIESPRNHSVGRLRELKPDGTQVIELRKPDQGPLGFYISRGNAEFNNGFFVSRFTDDHDSGSKLAGLLSVGDEILEINDYLVNDMTLDDVYDVLAQQKIIILRILPLLARKDV